MIPIRLQIKNFVSYGPKIQTINFEPYNLICLSGKNGHGKSALLDALTWCLWGQARKIGGIAKADEGLVRLGQSNMMVCLDFICNNLHYRVRREYTLTNSKSYSHLDFGVIDKETEKFKPLTDKTIRITQEKIEKTLGLDYDSFINSAFLRQGQSNEFSKKTPKDRKEILATILGINQFEELRKKAQEKAKNIISQREHTLQTMQQCQIELKEKESVQKELQNTNENFKYLLEKENLLKYQNQQAKDDVEKISHIKIKRQQLNFEKTQLQSNIFYAIDKFKEETEKFRKINKEKHKLFEFKNIEQQYQTAKIKLKEIQLIQIKQLSLKEQQILLKEKINSFLDQSQKAFMQKFHAKKLEQQTLNHNLQTETNKKEEYTALLLSQIQELKNLEENLIELNVKLIESKKFIENYELEEKQFDKRKTFFNKFLSQKNFIISEQQNVINKKNIIQNNSQSQCPLCDQNLAANDKQKICNNIEKQESFYNYRIKKLIVICEQLKKVIVAQQTSLDIQKNHLKQFNLFELKKTDAVNKQKQLTENLASLNNAINESELKINTQRQLLDKVNSEIIMLEQSQQKSILQNEIYITLSKELESVTLDLQSNSYDPLLEKEIIEKLNKLEKYKEDQTSLLQELALQEERKKNVNSLNQQIKVFRNQLTQINVKLQEISDLDYQESELNKKINYLKISYEQLLEQKENFILKKGALEQQNKYLLEQEKKYYQLKQLLNTLEQSAEEYKAIAVALSKDGIQALLIEDALPEIEQEANSILSKLTDNQAQLSFDSLRDLRNGNTKETLDIKISDSMGIRSYELFSGGEAFRIDFSLRIAISKLLARRAGTALQTLIIDEGFGSQDEEGLANIMQAIYKIQDDFSKVIVVSHLQTMKEQFPIHFIVHKGPDGSSINIIEQD